MRISARHFAASAAASAFIACAGAAFADVKAGVDAWQAGNYSAAIREWRPLADQGDADAQFNLGQAYKLGRGVPGDLKVAESWYEKAAQQGHPQAQANLGLILFQNGERQRAMPWIRRAADAGDPRAQYVLGTALFNGDVVGKDWPRAYALMSRAAAQGLPQAAGNLTQMDKFIPVAQRRQGLALAQQMEHAQHSGPPAPPRPAPVRPNTALASTLPAQPRVHIIAPPPPPAAKPAPARPAPAAAAAPGGGWRIQLGAFGSAANAQKQWAALRGKAGALAALRPITVQAGPITRLQAGPLANRAAAEHACAAAKAAGSACFPVAP